MRHELRRDGHGGVRPGQPRSLFAQFPEGSKHSIYPSSETTFHYVVDEVRLEFEMGADGRAKRVVIHATDETVPAERID